MTSYALLMQVCGLSLREAAELHAVRPDTVKSWSAGRNRPPPGVIAELRALARLIARAADEAAAMIADMPEGADIELGYPADDHEARALGWPCVGAWRALAARIIAATDRPVRLVPRGSTGATAAAADAHGV